MTKLKRRDNMIVPIVIPMLMAMGYFDDDDDEEGDYDDYDNDF